MERILEPEIMDTQQEAIEYDAMDFTEVNTAFAEKAISLAPDNATILDAGTGTARIPILICKQRSDWTITAIDLAKSMLAIGRKNIQEADLETQIILELVDAKHLPYPSSSFDFVISNSLVHHLPDPLPFFREIKRVLKPNGGIFIRDLLRPDSKIILEQMVAAIGLECNEHQKQLFRDSLHAAFTLEEIKQFLEAVHLQNVKLYQSSERHWTAEKAYFKP